MKEDQVIGMIKEKLNMKNSDVIAGPGDDTAVLKYSKTHRLLLTTDCIVENVHFKRNEASFFRIGRKAMAVNLSDIAAMGGVPLYALASVGMPAGLPRRDISQMIRGMQCMADRYGFDIVGGNLSSAPVLFIDVSMAGKVEKKFLRLRSGAKPGDAIFVTGVLGGSILGKHLDISPRIKEGRHIISSVPVSAMMDISDGLSTDLSRMAEASGTGFIINLGKIPVSKAAVKISAGDKNAAIRHALNDGEDYELLFSVPSDYRDRVPSRVESVPITCIGEMTKEKRFCGISAAGETDISPAGYSHF